MIGGNLPDAPLDPPWVNNPEPEEPEEEYSGESPISGLLKYGEWDWLDDNNYPEE